MSFELEALLALLIGAGVSAAATPPMARLARALGIIDVPGGYKQHGRPTPYLGGVAVLVGVLAAMLIVAGVSGPVPWVALTAAAVCALGTIDDRSPVPPGVRLIIQAGIATLAWAAGFGWELGLPGWANFVLTIGFVLLAANAFNLIDNIDGTAAGSAAMSAAGVGVIALGVATDSWPVVLAAATVGACLAFLPFNLATPSRIFLGDGGSTLLGFLLAVAAMGTLGGQSVLTALGAAALLVAVPALDTAITMVSRFRRGSPILAGGRDHVTHLIYARVGSTRLTAAIIAIAQGAFSVLAIAVVRWDVPVVLVLGGLVLLTALATIIWTLRPGGGKAADGRIAQLRKAG